MAQQKQGVREMRLVFETDGGNFSRTDKHIMERITNALALVNNTNISFAFFDESGHRVRKIEFGEASPAMKKIADFELEEAPEGVGA
jgi:hypothetical protein